MDDSGDNFDSKELAGWDPTGGLQLQLGTWSLLALALTLRVAGLSGQKLGALITALTLSVSQRLGGVSLRSKGKFCKKEGQRGIVGAEQLKLFQFSLRSRGRTEDQQRRGGLGPS